VLRWLKPELEQKAIQVMHFKTEGEVMVERFVIGYKTWINHHNWNQYGPEGSGNTKYMCCKL